MELWALLVFLSVRFFFYFIFVVVLWINLLCFVVFFFFLFELFFFFCRANEDFYYKLGEYQLAVFFFFEKTLKKNKIFIFLIDGVFFFGSKMQMSRRWLDWIYMFALFSSRLCTFIVASATKTQIFLLIYCLLNNKTEIVFVVKRWNKAIRSATLMQNDSRNN